MQKAEKRCITLQHAATDLQQKGWSQPAIPNHDSLQLNTTHCNTLATIGIQSIGLTDELHWLPQISATHWKTMKNRHQVNRLYTTATQCDTQQHTTTHRNTPQRTATHCNTLQQWHQVNRLYSTSIHCNASATHNNTLQHTCNNRHKVTRLYYTAIHCNTLAAHCNSLQHTATHLQVLASSESAFFHRNSLQHTCSTLQLIAKHCNTLATVGITSNGFTPDCHWVRHSNSLQLTATHSNSLQLTATHCNYSLQLAATHCKTLQHAALH